MAPVQNENDRSLEHTVLRSLRDRSFSHVSGSRWCRFAAVREFLFLGFFLVKSNPAEVIAKPVDDLIQDIGLACWHKFDQFDPEGSGQDLDELQLGSINSMFSPDTSRSCGLAGQGDGPCR